MPVNGHFLRGMALAMVLLVVAGCSSSSGKARGGPEPTETTAGATPSTSLIPQKGGVITIGQFGAPPGLDPALLNGTAAAIGGMVLAALYDTIMRLDPATGKYEPLTAQSFTPNADFTQWTLKLKPGIEFTDGTDYNSAAVQFSIDREMRQGNPQIAVQLKNFIDSVVVQDPLTTIFKLKLGWAGFPYLLSGAGGMVYSPAAVAKAGANFNVAPVGAGAGPFKFKSFTPGEAIELERNPNYYGGDVYLDGLRFVLISGGAAANYQAMKANSLQAAFVRDPVVVAQAKSDGYGTVDIPAVAGSVIVMNSGVKVSCAGGKPAVCAGVPDGTKVAVPTSTADVRVRQAVGAAVDPNLINQRVYNGTAQATSALFVNTPFDPKVAGPKYDLNHAKQLVQDAKADGWDGKIRLLGANDPQTSLLVLTISAMLQQAGMNPVTDTTKDTAAVSAQVLVQNAFDLVIFGIGTTDEADGNYTQLLANFGGSSPRYGYSNPELDAAFDSLRTADTTAKVTLANAKISEIVARDVPVLPLANLTVALIAIPKLHGVRRNAQQNVIFDKAWLEP